MLFMPDARPLHELDGIYQHVLTQHSSTYLLVLVKMIIVVLRVSLSFSFSGDFTQWLKIGYQIGQVRVVFKLPPSASNRFEALQSKHLAYVEWFSPFSQSPEPHHGLHKVSRALPSGRRKSAIVEVSRIHQSIHLFPCFGGPWRSNWNPDNVLESCDTFLVNSFQNRQSYLTVY